MQIQASRHPVAREVIVVTNEYGMSGGVVYRWNENHKVGTRTTNHKGNRPSMAAIRSAINSL